MIELSAQPAEKSCWGWTLQSFGDDCWPCIVVNCKTEPQLYVLQNSAARLQPREGVGGVRYLVDRTQLQTVAQAMDALRWQIQ